MSEESERVISGPEGNGAGVDPTAVALALAGADREEANAFLRDQRALIERQSRLVDLQAKELAHELKLRHWSLQLRHASAILKLALEVSAALIGVAIASALAFLIWNAANSKDLVFDSFAVPPDLAARGLSGPVVAAKLSDKIAAMQAETASNRPPKSYANGLAGLKLEIPETGVSLSELDNFLREKLGDDQHIGGEIVQLEKDVALTARVGSDGSATVTGAETDMDALLQKLAEQVYRVTQPYRYAYWAQAHGRLKEGVALLNNLTASGPDTERAWAYLGSGIDAYQYESEYAGQTLFRRGLVLDPNNYLLVTQIAGSEYRLGRLQDSIRDYGAAMSLVQAHGQDYTERSAVTVHADHALMLTFQGAFLEAVDENRTAIAEAAGARGAVTTYAASLARSPEFFAAVHEPGTARVALAQNRDVATRSINRGNTLITQLHARLIVALETQDWPEALTIDRALPQVLAQYPGFAESRVTYFDPLVALALAHTGQFAAAEARLKPMPADCYPCLRARAQVAVLQKQDARADSWFARAVAEAPIIPFAYADWGQALLDRGQPDAAIAQFTIAHQKGPHFADPLEGWGEALMAKNQSHLALAKFAEAEKYAPNWGRLHLKWGEALVYAGHAGEAKMQFARAAQLDLTPSEKAEFARHP